VGLEAYHSIFATPEKKKKGKGGEKRMQLLNGLLPRSVVGRRGEGGGEGKERGGSFSAEAAHLPLFCPCGDARREEKKREGRGST